MYLNCFIERKSSLMAIKRRVKKIKGRKQGNCFGTRNKIVGSRRFSINDEFRTLIRDNVVVTITDNDNKKIERKKYDNNRRTEK